MPAFIAHAFGGSAPAALALRFGRMAGSSGDGSVRWLLKRNCSISPRQLLAFYLTLCTVSLGIAFAFWHHGAWLVMPFAGAELLALGAALLVYAHHAADRESVLLEPGRLTVERSLGRRTEHVEFAPAWVRIEPVHGDRSLIELSGEGKHIAVGRFVRPELRRALADELRVALRRRGAAAGTPPDPGAQTE